MPSSGTGVGTPIVPGPASPDTSMPEWCTGALPISIYAKRYIGAECGMWGVSNPEESINFIWSLYERQELARALCEAQEELEEVMGYFLEPKWIANEPHLCSPTGTYLTNWNHLIASGTGKIAVIEEDSPVDHASDPAVVGAIAT
ncbi:MAG: hypothetical protein ACXABY_24830, partial [Candidatus Thorarchaeota archaeon]